MSCQEGGGHLGSEFFKTVDLLVLSDGVNAEILRECFPVEALGVSCGVGEFVKERL